jgi:hypothetical protein
MMQMDVTTEDIFSDDPEVRDKIKHVVCHIRRARRQLLSDQVWPFDHSRANTFSVASGSFTSEDDSGSGKYSTVLLKLAPGQEVSFEFIARLGIGKVFHCPCAVM